MELWNGVRENIGEIGRGRGCSAGGRRGEEGEGWSMIVERCRMELSIEMEAWYGILNSPLTI